MGCLIKFGNNNNNYYLNSIFSGLFHLAPVVSPILVTYQDICNTVINFVLLPDVCMHICALQSRPLCVHTHTPISYKCDTHEIQGNSRELLGSDI